MDCSIPGLLVHHQLPEFTQTHVIESVMPSSHLILCCPLLVFLSIFRSIKVFSNELALCIRWPKYQSFSFSVSPSSEYSGLISFRFDWFDLLTAVQHNGFRMRLYPYISGCLLASCGWDELILKAERNLRWTLAWTLCPPWHYFYCQNPSFPSRV